MKFIKASLMLLSVLTMAFETPWPYPASVPEQTMACQPIRYTKRHASAPSSMRPCNPIILIIQYQMCLASATVKVSSHDNPRFKILLINPSHAPYSDSHHQSLMSPELHSHRKDGRLHLPTPPTHISPHHSRSSSPTNRLSGTLIPHIMFLPLTTSALFLNITLEHFRSTYHVKKVQDTHTHSTKPTKADAFALFLAYLTFEDRKVYLKKMIVSWVL